MQYIVMGRIERWKNRVIQGIEIGKSKGKGRSKNQEMEIS